MIRKLFQVELDLRALAALRIALGFLVLLDVILRCRDLSAFYTDLGVLPRLTLLQIPHPTLLNFFNMVGTASGAFLLLAMLGAASLGLIVGWNTRICTFIVWVLHMALKHRNPLILHAGDLELGLVLWWALFLPISARYSLDARKNPQWASLPNAYSSVATAGYILQLSLMYLMAGLLKSDPVWRETGLALYYCFQLDQFATGLGQTLLSYPGFLQTLTFFALGTELAIPFLLWFPWKRTEIRWCVCGLTLLFHSSIALTLNLGLMPLINILMMIGLWPGRPFEILALRFGNTPKESEIQDPSTLQLGKWTRAFLLLICVYICHLNYSVYRSQIVPLPIKYFGYLFRQQQTWSLFAPHPGVRDGWFVVEGLQVNGSTVDLWQNGADVSFEKPKSVASSYKNQRWRLWWLNLINRNDPLVNESFSRYLAQSWNQRHREPERVKRVRIFFVLEQTEPPGASIKHKPYQFYEFVCPLNMYKKVNEVYLD